MELNQKFFNPSIEWQLRNCAAYESFSNNECHIPFQFYISDYKPLKWQDITVLEEYWLLRKIQLPLLFPNIPMAEEIRDDFFQGELFHSVWLTHHWYDSTFLSNAQKWLKNSYPCIYHTKHVSYTICRGSMEQLHHSHSRDWKKCNYGFILRQAITKTTWPSKVYTLFKGIPSTLFSNADLDNLLWMYSRYKL